MNINKRFVLLTVVAIIIIITVPTVYKIIKNYQNNLYRVVEGKIISATKKCYLDEVCKDDKVSLQMLYENNYLETMSDPLTKENYNKESYVKKDNNKYEFVVVE